MHAHVVWVNKVTKKKEETQILRKQLYLTRHTGSNLSSKPFTLQHRTTCKRPLLIMSAKLLNSCTLELAKCIVPTVTERFAGFERLQ